MAPIHSLPEDLLRKIFHYHCANSRGLLSRWIHATEVCHLWRNIFLDDGAFWSNICSLKAKVISHQLELSKQAPLDVEGGHKIPDNHVEIIELVAPHIGRVRKLVIVGLQGRLLAMVNKLFDSTSTPGQLEELTLHLHVEATAARRSVALTPLQFGLQGAPQLRVLDFLGPLSWTHFPSPNTMRILSVDDRLFSGGSYQFIAVLDALRAMPLLEELRLRLKRSALPSCVGLPVVYLLYLRQLLVELSTDDLVVSCAIIIIPASCSCSFQTAIAENAYGSDDAERMTQNVCSILGPWVDRIASSTLVEHLHILGLTTWHSEGIPRRGLQIRFHPPPVKNFVPETALPDAVFTLTIQHADRAALFRGFHPLWSTLVLRSLAISGFEESPELQDADVWEAALGNQNTISAIQLESPNCLDMFLAVCADCKTLFPRLDRMLCSADVRLCTVAHMVALFACSRPRLSALYMRNMWSRTSADTIQKAFASCAERIVLLEQDWTIDET
jgi:hypothetical protein